MQAQPWGGAGGTAVPGPFHRWAPTYAYTYTLVIIRICYASTRSRDHGARSHARHSRVATFRLWPFLCVRRRSSVSLSRISEEQHSGGKSKSQGPNLTSPLTWTSGRDPSSLIRWFPEPESPFGNLLIGSSRRAAQERIEGRRQAAATSKVGIWNLFTNCFSHDLYFVKL